MHQVLRSPRAKLAAGALAIGVTAFVSGGLVFSEGHALARSALLQSAAATAPALPNSPLAHSPRLVPSTQQFSFADLVERVSPAVVSVQVDIEQRMQSQATPEIPAPFRDFFGRCAGGERFVALRVAQG